MARTSFAKKPPPPRFTQSETKEMERLILEARDEPFDQALCQRIAKKINLHSARMGKKAIQWKQIERWARNKQKTLALRSTSAETVSKELNTATCVSVSSCKSTSEMLVGKENSHELEFEARSSRDGAWYDVASFLSHRITDFDAFEALVRYQDFDADEDEWVNVNEAVRKRSIPLESTECYRVAVGDLVICFNENKDQARYFDAHVLKIQRKLHDIRGCRCRFLIQYDHNKIEEIVHLGRLCRRP